MTQAIVYVKAQENDIPLLASLDKLAFNRPFDNAFTEKEFSELIHNDKVSLFLVMKEALPIGFYIFEDTKESEGEIVGIALSPTHQKQRIGTEILLKLIKEYGHKKTIKVVTHPQNTVALLLYLKHGFVISEYSDSYYGPYQPRVILYKKNY
ncbi:MAG: GNAT family N-acetyltransferase [Candidatus Roizmanbacteria bacterium]|nr:GNAT family N-acetyltransferase [Candidatus Roizmanbacteria bacterium]